MGIGIGPVRDIVGVVRELNLKAIKQEAERRFLLLVAGEEALARPLAEQLGAVPERSGTHPWIDVHALPLSVQQRDLSHYDIALIVTDEVELSEAAASTVRRLHEDKTPVVTVVVSESALSVVGGDVPRRREAKRVVLPPSLDEKVLRDKLAPAILEAVRDELGLAIARQLPVFRAAKSHALIEETSRANALYAASTGVAQIVPVLTIPLNVADVVVLTKNQLIMAFKIALANGKEGTAREIMGEVISVLGGGLLFRQIARELVGLIPVIGIIPKIAVAYAGTWVIGRTIYLWATEGERLDTEEMRRFYDEAIVRGRALAETLVETVRDRAPALAAPEAQEPGFWQRVRQRLPF
ncbi:MAG: hypothetical protein M3220_01650 [Chloroflexota bacterium]|nr:hypothetical protein [Chloroflexota bacterium]